MNTRAVNAAAGVILAAQQQGRTAAGIAMALESAQLLQSPETADELERLRLEAAGLRSQLALFNEWRTADGARIAELLAERHFTNEALDDAVQELRARRDAEVVDRSADRLTRLLAPTQALLEDPHDSPLHHRYALGRDLPPLGGVQ